MVDEEKKKQKVLKTPKNQPIKRITQEDIEQLKNQLERLSSWTQPLQLLESFFAYQSIPLNKKQIIREFYAQSAIYLSFKKTFLDEINIMDMKLQELEKREKVKI
ncbi:hypothetical protein A5886_000236 [Enterococcus sp. 8G7_MSG3316]|uniref:Uncharacterized protein n=1 Tax=Candidatus Enterococcus testudinis TaxID=1834191 RepID=A0A242A2A5_9ENTE|nr:hypothetical protein [Enterococcus sp. 8G7_MSG3316]OTN75166.1 hypothetical protein A5886_000236 [Enterococcus sp. 8G7_MSG3316]